SGTMLG
ncbi:hypothetical protein D039_4998B, partial [Vibrio parahaemolyticus EKP-028]